MTATETQHAEVPIPPPAETYYKREHGPNTYSLAYYGCGLTWAAATQQKDKHWYNVAPTTRRVLDAVMDLLRDNHFSAGPSKWHEDFSRNYAKVVPGHKYREDPYHRGGHFFMPCAGTNDGKPFSALLEFEAEVNPGSPGFKIEFFTEYGCEPGRGRYDGNRIQQMPYLMRLKVQHIIRQIIRLLETEFGASRGDRPRGATVAEDILIEREYCWHRDRYGSMTGCYQQRKTTRDGVPMVDGMKVYFTSYGEGQVMRGVAFDNLNDMLKIAAPGISGNAMQLHYSHCWSAFPGERRWFNQQTRLDRLKAAIARHVKAEDYMRAHSAKKALDRMQSK